MLHLGDEFSRHEVALVLLLNLVLEVAADDVENVVVEDKAVAEAALVAHSRDHQVLAFGQAAAGDSAQLSEKRLFDEDDQEHLVHRHVRLLLVDILEPLRLEEEFKLLRALVNLGLEALLRGEEDHIVVCGVGQELILLVCEDLIVRAAHVPRDGQNFQVLHGACCGRFLRLFIGRGGDRLSNRSESGVVVLDAEQGAKLK